MFGSNTLHLPPMFDGSFLLPLMQAIVQRERERVYQLAAGICMLILASEGSPCTAAVGRGIQHVASAGTSTHVHLPWEVAAVKALGFNQQASPLGEMGELLVAAALDGCLLWLHGLQALQPPCFMVHHDWGTDGLLVCCGSQGLRRLTVSPVVGFSILFRSVGDPSC